MKVTSEFKDGNIFYRDGIVHIEYNQGTIIDEQVLINGIVCRKKLTGEDFFFMLLDMTNAADITEGALLFASENPSPEKVRAIAVITRTGTDHVRAKLYSVFDNPNIQTKAFLSADSARQWFQELSQGQSEKAA
jgi:hypothetical protein